MKKSSIVYLLLLNFYFVSAQSQYNTAIRQILTEQQAAWNSGNIDAFMEGYWKNDSLVFVGKSGPKYGWQNTLNNYKKNYPDTATMGQLNFEILEIKTLGKDHAFVLGKWFLKRTVGNVQGVFTLIFRRFKNAWKIIADHSS